MTSDIPEDLYLNYIDEKNDYTIQYLQTIRVLKLNKEKENLTLLCAKRSLTEEQNTKFIQLQMELEKYPDDKGLLQIQKKAKINQLKLYKNTCYKQNKANLDLIMNNFQTLREQERENKRNKTNEYMTQKVKCECGDEIIRANLYRHKNTKAHFEKLNNILKPVLSEEEKRNNTNEYMKEKLTCECGEEISRCNMPRHKQTKKHLKKISINNSD